MDIHVPESEQRWLRAVLILGTLVLALILIAQVSVILVFFSDILLIVLLGWLLAFILSPIVGLVLRAFPQMPRGVVVGLLYVALLLGLGWGALVVAGSLANSIGNFITELPSLQARLPEIVAPLQNGLASLGFQIDVIGAAQELLVSLGNIGDKLVQPLTDLALFSVGIIGNLFLVIFLSLFILLDQDRILAYFNRIVPPRWSETARLFETSVSTSFGGFIRGTVLQGLIMAAVAAVAHVLFGLDFLPASAALSGVLQLIPFFGPFFAWIPPVLVAILTKPEAVIPTAIYMGIGWFLLSNIITPRLMANAVGLHPIVVLISVVIGAKIAGIAGAIFAVPFAAVISAFFQHYLGRNVREPRDVTSRAAKRVGEREGRRVRVPQPPPVTAAETDLAPSTPTTVEPEPRPKPTS